MMIQRLRRYLPFALGRRTVCRFVTSLMLLGLMVMDLPALTGDQQTCGPDGDVDQSGSVAAADALLAFQQALSLTQLSACQLSIADVSPRPATPDGTITVSDALCILQKALGLPSCLDDVPPPNESPIVNAGVDQTVDEGTMVILSGTASDPHGTIVSYAWTQTETETETDGTMVALAGADSAIAAFLAPDVITTETLTLQLTVTDNDGAQASDEVSVTVTNDTEIDVVKYLTGPVEHGWPPGLLAAVIDEEGVRAIGRSGWRAQAGLA